jgi:hypothetical protein
MFNPIFIDPVHRCMGLVLWKSFKAGQKERKRRKKIPKNDSL